MTVFENSVTLDALFQRNAAAHPQAIAVSESGTHRARGVARALTYAELDNAVAHIAAQLQAFRLPHDCAVALHLPNGTELVAALLAVMRAGHTALPLPVLWRKSDLVRALREAETSALITTANFTPENLTALAAEVAGEVFELSFPCAFGDRLPDGVMPLTISTAAPDSGAATERPPATRIMTLGVNDAGIVLYQRNDEELLAAGLGPLIAGDMRTGDTILAATSLASIAGIAGAFVPWLLGSGTLHMLDDFPAASSIAPDKRLHIVSSARALEAICTSVRAPIGAAIAVHQDGGADGYEFRDVAAERIVDVHAFNEAAVIALRRTQRGVALSIPLGAVHAGSATADAPVVIETKLDSDMRLFVRGPMVPAAEGARDQWRPTGFTGIIQSKISFKADTPDDLITIGGLRFSITDLDRRIKAACPDLRVAMIEDPLLGTRLAIWAEDPEKAALALLDAGLPRIIANAVLQSEAARATG